jgi:hypothetical protein
MLHACLCTICFVFCYTSWYFYAFSRTNLLTRCHSASFPFSAFFVFQKSYTGNILRIGRNEAQTSYFSRHETKTEGEPEGGPGASHTLGWHAPPWPHRVVVWGPWSTSDIAPMPIKSLRSENPKSIGVSPSKVPQRRRHRRPISGDRSLCSAPCRDGEVPPEPSLSTTSTPPPSPSTSPPSPSMLLSLMMRRE